MLYGSLHRCGIVASAQVTADIVSKLVASAVSQAILSHFAMAQSLEVLTHATLATRRAMWRTLGGFCHVA